MTAPVLSRLPGRWYPLLLLRDGLGRFSRLRVKLVTRPVARRPRRRRMPAPLQLVLF